MTLGNFKELLVRILNDREAVLGAIHVTGVAEVAKRAVIECYLAKRPEDDDTATLREEMFSFYSCGRFSWEY